MLPSKKVRRPFFLSIRFHKISLVSDIYTSGWKNPRTPCPGIKKVYKVVMKPDFPHKYEEYRYGFISLEFLAFHPLLRRLRRKVPSNVLVKRKGNEKQVWLGLRRDCGFGDAGVMEPCSSKQCILCSLVRSSVSKEAAHEGITTTQSLFRYLLNSKVHSPFLTNLQSHRDVFADPQKDKQCRPVGGCHLRSESRDHEK